MNYKQAGNSDSGYGGCLLIPFILLLSMIASGQQTTTVKVLPSKDTTVVKFITTTTTTTNTQVSYTTVSIPTKDSNITTPPVDTTTGYSLVYSSGYDNLNDIDPFGHNQWGSDAKANHLSLSVFHTGPGSFKSLPVGNVSSGVRSEVQYEDAQTPLEGLIDYWVNYAGFNSCCQHSIQFHPTTSGGSGTGFYHVGTNKLDFVSVEQGTTGTHYPMNYTVPLNKWIHIQWYYKWGAGGYSKVVIDGVTVCDVQNKKIGDGSRPFLKIGQNQWSGTPQTVYYDDVKIYRKN